MAKVTITGSNSGSQIAGEFKNGQSFRTFAPSQFENLVNTMLDKGVAPAGTVSEELTLA